MNRWLYVGLAFSTVLSGLGTLWTCYTLPFNTSWRNFGAVFNETALFSLFCISFAFLRADHFLTYDHFEKYGFVFGLFVFLVVVINVPLVILDTIAYLRKLGLLCTKGEEIYSDVDPNAGLRLIDDDGAEPEGGGDSVMTEKEISLEEEEKEPEEEKKEEDKKSEHSDPQVVESFEDDDIRVNAMSGAKKSKPPPPKKKA